MTRHPTSGARGCLCQRYGKTGVPNARGFCLVCGERVASLDPPPRTQLDVVGTTGGKATVATTRVDPRRED